MYALANGSFATRAMLAVVVAACCPRGVVVLVVVVGAWLCINIIHK